MTLSAAPIGELKGIAKLLNAFEVARVTVHED